MLSDSAISFLEIYPKQKIVKYAKMYMQRFSSQMVYKRNNGL